MFKIYGWSLLFFATLFLTAALDTEYAVGQGVPSLGSTAADYVSYADTNLPAHFQAPPIQNADNTPATNPITNTGAELGRVLFYDTRLSHNDGTSCASCHVQENGFSDPNQLSIGFEGGLTGRHSMGLANARYYQNGRFFWDERAATLEDQVLQPIQDAVEMGSNLPDLVNELQATEFYPTLFQRAFGDTAVTSERISLALAQFVRSMVSYQSPFDAAVQAGTPMNPNFSAVPEIADPASAQRGHAIFQGSCASCHGTTAQIANAPQNIGLDEVDTDQGAGDGEFKVPSLRNIAVREGYMHDGRFQTLEEVVEFYSSGIQNNPNRGRGLPVGGFGFTSGQSQDLLNYLATLTDNAFLTSDLFSDPFITLEGDYNGDGVVDLDDYNEWSAAYGTTSGDVSGPLFIDGNGDGVVNALDFTLWRNNLGARWDDSPAAVPEPSGAVLVCMLAIALGSRRGLRSRCRSSYG